MTSKKKFFNNVGECDHEEKIKPAHDFTQRQ